MGETWGHGRNRIHRIMAVKIDKRNPAGARGKDCSYGTFWVVFLINGCVQRGHALVYELIAIWEPWWCTNFFLIDNSSHLNCIFSFKANTAFPCNKPNKIKYQEETC